MAALLQNLNVVLKAPKGRTTLMCLQKVKSMHLNPRKDTAMEEKAYAEEFL